MKDDGENGVPVTDYRFSLIISCNTFALFSVTSVRGSKLINLSSVSGLRISFENKFELF